MRNELDNMRTTSRRKHCNVVTDAMGIFYAVVILLLVIHLFIVQIFDFQKYRERGKMQRSSHDFAVRGDIYDRHGIKLATDRIYYNIYARPVDYSEKETPEKIAKLFAPILKISESELRAKLTNKKIPVIAIKKDVDRDTAKKIMKVIGENNFRSISLDKKNTREYPQGVFASHVLGFYNFDADVSNGVELTAKDKLEHVVRATRYQRTRDGKIIYNFSTDPVVPTMNPKGQDVYLTIDAAIQHVCEKELQKIIHEKDALRGAVIVMNPKNGEILAYAVYPTYDPNKFQKASNTQIKNWTLTDVYPPGSTFKTITVTSAMELGKINDLKSLVLGCDADSGEDCGDCVACHDADDEGDHFCHLLTVDRAGNDRAERDECTEEAKTCLRSHDADRVCVKRYTDSVVHCVDSKRQTDESDGRTDDYGRHQLGDPFHTRKLDDQCDDDVNKTCKPGADEQTEVPEGHGNAASECREHRRKKRKRRTEEDGALELREEQVDDRAGTCTEQSRRLGHPVTDDRRNGNGCRQDREQLLERKDQHLTEFGSVIHVVDEFHDLNSLVFIY